MTNDNPIYEAQMKTVERSISYPMEDKVRKKILDQILWECGPLVMEDSDYYLHSRPKKIYAPLFGLWMGWVTYQSLQYKQNAEVVFQKFILTRRG